MHLAEIFLLERFEDPTDLLAPYTGDGVYITFSDLQKVGVNPRSEHSTPTGVYAYPLDQVWTEFDKDDLPFAGDRPFIHVLEPRGRIIDVMDYGQDDWERDLAKLSEIDPEGVEKFRQVAMDTALPARYYASFMWNLTRLMSGTHHEREDDFDNRLDDELFEERPARWNALLRKLGYDVITDTKGLGLIHKNEPKQAVFLSPRGYQHILTVRNNRRAPQGKIAVRGLNLLLHKANNKPYIMALLQKEWPQLLRSDVSHSFKIIEPQKVWAARIAQDDLKLLLGAMPQKGGRNMRRLAYGMLGAGDRIHMETFVSILLRAIHTKHSTFADYFSVISDPKVLAHLKGKAGDLIHVLIDSYLASTPFERVPGSYGRADTRASAKLVYESPEFQKVLPVLMQLHYADEAISKSIVWNALLRAMSRY